MSDDSAVTEAAREYAAAYAADYSEHDLERAAGAPSKIHVFVSFDIEHDGELYELLLAQSRTTISGFAVLGSSERSTATDVSSERARRRIRRADQVIVICGEHTDASMGVFAELRIAQEEKKPYFLLWGRREIMCTKPIGAKTAEGMYSWTRQILQQQITLMTRKAHWETAARGMKRPGKLEQSGARIPIL